MGNGLLNHVDRMEQHLISDHSDDLREFYWNYGPKNPALLPQVLYCGANVICKKLRAEDLLALRCVAKHADLTSALEQAHRPYGAWVFRPRWRDSYARHALGDWLNPTPQQLEAGRCFDGIALFPSVGSSKLRDPIDILLWQLDEFYQSRVWHSQTLAVRVRSWPSVVEGVARMKAEAALCWNTGQQQKQKEQATLRQRQKSQAWKQAQRQQQRANRVKR